MFLVPLPLELIKREPTTLKYTFHQLSSTSRIYEYKVVEERKLPIGTCDVAKLTCIATSLVSGTPYTVYLVACYRSGNETFCSEKSDPTTSYTSPFPCEIVGLRPSTRYTIAVRSWLDLALSDIPSDAKTCSVSTQSAQPANVTPSSITPSVMVVTFKAPNVATGIGLYEVSVVGGNQFKSCTILSTNKLECLLDDLLAATEYQVTARSCVDVVEPFVCSTNVTVSAWTRSYVNFSVIVSPESSESLRTSIISPVQVKGVETYVASVEGYVELTCIVDASSANSCVINGLNAATNYTIAVTAWINGHIAGTSSGNGWTRPTTPCRLLQFDQGTTYLRWKFASLEDPRWLYEYRVVDATNIGFGECEIASLTCVATALTPCTTYTAYLIACLVLNGVNICSERSTPDYTTTIPNFPSKIIVSTVSSTSLNVSIEPPTDAPAGVDHYKAEILGGEHLCCSAKASPSPSCAIDGLRPATIYTVVVRAWMSGRFSGVSSASATAYGRTAPPNDNPNEPAYRHCGTDAFRWHMSQFGQFIYD
ncbi:unnamed protein product [Mesocestoides corti]|uniref:Fibronectin type-III domain-containing protein n=1 Tax=Mesocestoides corti TaxID=53468 RepID=A0A0R3UB02_MESCO|nr:unnamed protein product [Mesocestoides corti]